MEQLNKIQKVTEEIINIIPSDYLVSKAFMSDCQNSPYAYAWSMALSISQSTKTMASLLFDVRTDSEKAEHALEAFLNQIYNNGHKTLYNFVVFLISSYCNNKQTKLRLGGLREALREIGISNFTEINNYAEDAPFTSYIISEIETWDEIKEHVRKLEKDCNLAETTIDFQNIGNSCRTLLIKVAQLVYDPNLHGKNNEKGVEIGKADAVGMISNYISYVLSGKNNKEYRDYAKATNAIANVLTHRTNATRKDMMITLSATTSLVFLIGVLENKYG